MSEQDGQTVDFGSQQPTEGGAAETSGGAVHRAGFMEAPAQVEGAAGEEHEGAVRPLIQRLTED